MQLRERKTGKIRTVALPSEITEAYKRHPQRGAFLYAFPSLRDGGRRKLHRTTYWRHFKRAVERAGFEGKGFSPHSLRKCYAVEKYRLCGDLREVQLDLGHNHISTTMLYALADVL